MDKNENFIVDGTATGVDVTNFPYDLQQPTKKINNPDDFKILVSLNIKEDLVINSIAKIAIRKRTHRVTKQKKKKKLNQKKSSRKKPANYLQRNVQTPEVFRNLKGRQNSARGDGLGVFRRMRKNCLC